MGPCLALPQGLEGRPQPSSHPLARPSAPLHGHCVPGKLPKPAMPGGCGLGGVAGDVVADLGGVVVLGVLDGGAQPGLERFGGGVGGQPGLALGVGACRVNPLQTAIESCLKTI